MLSISYAANQTPYNTNKVIYLGMSNALSGPASNLGRALRKGAKAYFTQLNTTGGINGRKVKLISLDDGYEPENTVENTKELIEQQVFSLFGYIGTPTSHAIMPILTKTNIPYLMPFTGADFLRNPVRDNIVNLRSSYHQEIEAQIEFLTEVKKFKNIALVMQADEFGLSVQRAVNQVFKQKKLKLILTARYKRNSDDINNSLKRLSAQPIDAVIFIGTYKPFIRLVTLASEKKLDILFTSLSFIGGHNLNDQLPKSSKVVLSEVMPAPDKCDWQLCEQFKRDMKKLGATELNRIQLEGYLNAFVFSEVAKKCAKSLTRECLLEEFSQYQYQDNELNIQFNNDNQQGLQKVYFSYSNALKSQSI